MAQKQLNGEERKLSSIPIGTCLENEVAIHFLDTQHGNQYSLENLNLIHQYPLVHLGRHCESDSTATL